VKPSKSKQERDFANQHLDVLPYVEGTSERIARVMRKHQAPVAMRPVKIFKITTGRRKLQTAYTKFHVQAVSGWSKK